MRNLNFLFSNSVQGESDLTRYCPRDAFEMPLTCPRHLFCKMLILSMLLFLGIGNVWGAEIYNENFGSNTTSKNRAFDESYFSDTQTSAIISTTWNQGRNAVNPSDFSGASGNACAQTSTNSATLILTFGDLSSYTDVTLTFGYRNDASAKGARTFTTHVSANGGTTWTEIDCNKSRKTQTWEKITYNVPDASLSNFAIKFTNTAGNNSRVDDIILTGTTAGTSVSLSKAGQTNGTISLSKGKRTDSPKQNQTQDNSYVWQKIG